MDDPPRVTFYTDENVPLAVVEELQRRGVDVLRCQEAGMMGRDDPDHLRLATAQGRAIITFDRDLLRLNKEFNSQGETHAGIVFVTNSHMGIGSIVKALLEIYETTRPDQLHNLVRFI